MAVAEAHIAGLEARLAAGGDIARVAGVASFFVSRIDGMIDKTIDKRIAAGDAESAGLRDLRGKVAIANAKLAYQHYLELVAGTRWRALAEAGARPQRLLWASTGTKDPAYPDTLYVDTLIGADTVNTMPPKTMDAFRDHGHARDTLTEDLDGARGVLAEVDRLGLDLNGVTRALVDDGVAKFCQGVRRSPGRRGGRTRRRRLGRKAQRAWRRVYRRRSKAAVKETLARAGLEGWSRRLWRKDASPWPGGQADRWLGWLDAADAAAVDFDRLGGLAGAGEGRLIRATRCSSVWADRALGPKCWR